MAQPEDAAVERGIAPVGVRATQPLHLGEGLGGR
jgi:hypothetical protein